jgi:hypothetical protein
MTDREKILECLPVTLRPEMQEIIVQDIFKKFPFCFNETPVIVQYTVEEVVETLVSDFLVDTRKQETLYGRAYLFTVLVKKFGMRDSKVSETIGGFRDRSSIWNNVYVTVKTQWYDPRFINATVALQKKFPLGYPFKDVFLDRRQNIPLPAFKIPKIVFEHLKGESRSTGERFENVILDALKKRYTLL